jgi:hypothetical protein
MAKSATAAKSGSKSGGNSTAVAKTSSGSHGGHSGGRSSSSSSSGGSAGDAFIKLLQSPLVADLLAVAGTAALAALAEHGFSSRGGDDNVRSKRAGKAVKEAGKAAAAAIGRRLSNELEEIREASKAKAGAEA